MIRNRRVLWSGLVCLFMLCLIGTASAAKKVSIPEGASVCQGHSYMVYQESVGWEQAQEACKKAGGHLVTITTKKEQQFIEKLLKKKGASDQYYWIGLTDQDDEGNWSRWITGEEVAYKNWGDGEPDNALGQNYGAIATGLFEGRGYRIASGQWDDIRGKAYGYICEWDTEPVAPTVTTGKAAGITAASARVSLTIDRKESRKIKECGIQYGGNKTETSNVKVDKKMTQSGTYTVKLSGLTAGKKVYYRAYVKTDSGAEYGSWKTFTTRKVTKPTVETLDARIQDESSGTFMIRLSGTGEAKVTDCGILWGYSEKSLKNRVSFGQPGSETGEYSGTLRFEEMEGFRYDTDICYQAYAKNKKGTAYGKVLTFRVTKSDPGKAFAGFTLSHVDREMNEDQRIRERTRDGDDVLDKPIVLIGDTPGARFTYQIESDAEWTVTGKGDWFTVEGSPADGSPVKGAAGKTFMALTFTDRVGDRADSGKLVFSFRKGRKITIRVEKPEYTAFDRAFTESSAGLNHTLANQSILGASAVYSSKSSAERFLQNLGFTDLKGYSYASGTHTAAHELGHKLTLDAEGNIVHLFAVMIRPTSSSNIEWKSNFTIGDGDVHYGFNQAAAEVKAHLDAYMKGYNSDITNGKYIVWITGHSRGAAVGNLLAGDYLSARPKSTVYAYLFATPNVSRNASSSAKNIKNFAIDGDLIPRLPMESWGFRKYGVVYTLSDAAAASYGLDVMTKEQTDKLVRTLGTVFTSPSQVYIIRDLLDDQGSVPDISQNRSGEVASSLEKILDRYIDMNMEELKTKIYNGHVPLSYQIWMRNAYPEK